MSVASSSWARGEMFVGARRDVELERPEAPASELYVDRGPPGQVHALLSHPRRDADAEDEAVAVLVASECLDEAVAQVGGVDVGFAQAEIEIFRESRGIVEADLHRHAALEHPAAGLRPLEPRDEPLEDHAPAQSVR